MAHAAVQQASHVAEKHRHWQDRLQISLVPVESSSSHCFPDPSTAGGGSECFSFSFSIKLPQQKMHLLPGAHLGGCAWSVEPFP